MRPDMIEASSPYNMNQESPKASCIWSTERRLLERPPPCRPQKSGRRTSLSAHICEQDNYEASTKKQRNDRLLLPSRTINEDDEFTPIALSFRRANLTSMFNSAASENSSEILYKDPTTVLLIPEMSPLPWYSNDEDENDDDMILSPRLFRFGQQQDNISCFASIDLADDDTSANNNIFRDLNSDDDDDDNNNNSVESRDIFSNNDETIQRRYTWANTTSGFPTETTPSDDDDRN